MHAEKKNITSISVALFAGFLFLALLFPYTGDDWAWGSTIGLERLSIFFDNYNGRYLGNLLVLALTRSKLLDAAVMALSYTLLCFFCYAYAKDRSAELLWFSAILFFIMPKEIFTQAIVWTSGYSNYVPSALISGAFLLMVRKLTGSDLPDLKEKPSRVLWMFMLGFCGALFVENVTVFHICLAAGMILYVFIKFRRFYREHFAFLSGAVLGALVMFSNSVYHEIMVGDDTYRHVPHSIYGLAEYVIEHAKVILSYIIYDNLPLCAIATVLLILLVLGSEKSGKSEAGTKWTLITFHLLAFLLVWRKDTILGAAWQILNYSSQTGFLLEVLAALLYIFSIFLIILCCVERDRKFRMLLPFYCVAGSLMPLVVVDPLGPRCVFVGYFLMTVFVTDLFAYVRKKILPARKWVCGILALIVAAQFAFYFSIFYPIHQYDLLRLDYVRRQADNGQQEVLICDLPNSDYLWNSAPDSSNLPYRYKLFYGLDTDLTFSFIPYQELEVLANETTQR